MKSFFHAFFMCQSMFCAIPCPCKIWDEEARDKLLWCLPLVGLEIGLLWWSLGLLCRFLGLSQAVSGIALCAMPFFATGFIHLDGFMDVTDAVGSCRDLAKRREILKDSHVGSFAVIGVVLLILCQFAFCVSFNQETDIRVLIVIPVVSRCGSAGIASPRRSAPWRTRNITPSRATKVALPARGRWQTSIGISTTAWKTRSAWDPKSFPKRAAAAPSAFR